MQNASHSNIKIKYNLLIFRFFRNRLEILLSAKIINELYQVDNIPFVYEGVSQNLECVLQNLMQGTQDWKCGPTQYLVDIPSYNDSAHHEVHRLTRVCLTPKHNNPSTNDLILQFPQTTSNDLQWHCVQNLLKHAYSNPQPEADLQSPHEKYHQSCLSWIQQALQNLQALSQTSTIPLSLLTPSFRFRHARFLYNQIWGEYINPQAFKAWMRKSQALERVGPSRYQAKKSLRKPWQIK